MKKLLVVLVLAAVVMSCGGSSGPSGSVDDISGRWKVEINNSGHPFYWLLTERPDGHVDGSHEGDAEAVLYGNKAPGTRSYFFAELRGPSYTEYEVTLKGGTFDGMAHSYIMGKWYEPKPVKGRRAD